MAVEIARDESRWPPVLAVLVVIALLEVLPDRIRLLPAWTLYVAAIGTIVPMLARALAPASAPWSRIERVIVFLFVMISSATTIVGLAMVIRMMVFHPGVSGLRLLASSVAVWVMNVLTFSLLYWEVDRGGPNLRASGGAKMPDWLFPHEGAAQQVPPGWRPTFADYLFLGYATATAFSPTDALPLTPRAKLLMMVESTISLVTIVIVAARAINILR